MYIQGTLIISPFSTFFPTPWNSPIFAAMFLYRFCIWQKTCNVCFSESGLFCLTWWGIAVPLLLIFLIIVALVIQNCLWFHKNSWFSSNYVKNFIVFYKHFIESMDEFEWYGLFDNTESSGHEHRISLYVLCLFQLLSPVFCSFIVEIFLLFHWI
jgi:hypothetical protein